MSLIFQKQKIKEKSLIFAWGLYDLANQFFALNIVSLYFVRWIIIECKIPERFYSISFGTSMFVVAFMAPLLGGLSDLIHRHRFFLVLFTLLSAGFTIGLGLTDNVFLALLFFAIANFGCQAAIIFYNALLVNIAARDKIGLVSGIGKMLGYCGAVLGLYIVHPFVLKGGCKAAFIPSGLLFFIFALPCMLFVKDKKSDNALSITSFLKAESIKLSFKKLFMNTLDLTKFRVISDFLKASFFCLCIVNIIILFMSVYATRVFGLNEAELVNLVRFSTLFAIVGSLISGYISDKLGYKRSLITVFLLWGVCLILGAFARSALFYWIIGPLVGVILGSTWVVSRALAVHIVPAEKIGQVFGLFSFIGYLSAIIGALFWGGILWLLSPLGILGYRIALLSLSLFLIPGFFYLRRIRI